MTTCRNQEAATATRARVIEMLALCFDTLLLFYVFVSVFLVDPARCLVFRRDQKKRIIVLFFVWCDVV